MIKATIEPPKERLVTITMSDTEAKLLNRFIEYCNDRAIEHVFGSKCKDSDRTNDLFEELYTAIESALDGDDL
jgi:hypothetical protein